MFDGNSSPDSVRYAVCIDWKDDGNWAARLPAQEAEGEQEEPLPPIQVGKEPEERVAQLALTFGVLEACDADGELFATFPSSGHCRQHCVMRAWD
jgi:hypothetical protein